MQFFATILGAALLCLSSVILTGASDAPSATKLENNIVHYLPAGYYEVPMTFAGYFGPHYVKVNGTINEVFDHVIKTFPDFDMNEYIQTDNKINARAASAYEKDWGAPHCCPVPGQSFSGASFGQTLQQAGYLTSVAWGSRGAEYCHINAGRGACSRVACLEETGIYVCNDNDFPYDFPCHEIGRAAIKLSSPCQFFGVNAHGQGQLMTCGQIFDDEDRINVFVTGGQRC